MNQTQTTNPVAYYKGKAGTLRQTLQSLREDLDGEDPNTLRAFESRLVATEGAAYWQAAGSSTAHPLLTCEQARALLPRADTAHEGRSFLPNAKEQLLSAVCRAAGRNDLGLFASWDEAHQFLQDQPALLQPLGAWLIAAPVAFD